MTVVLGFTLISVAGFQTKPTTAPATKPATQATTRPMLPKISIYSLSLGGGTDIKITPEGVLTCTDLDPFAPKKPVTLTLNELQIARLATAIQETLGRPSRPEQVTDHYMKLTIGEQTWETHDIDDKFVPLFTAVYEFIPRE